MLGIPFDFCPDISYKQVRFSITLLKKSLKFILSRRDRTIVFNLSFVLLSTEINPITEEKSCKRDAFETHNTSYIKIILTLSTKIVIFYMQAPIL